MPFYITTAISYVNGAPHLGHAYEAIATDVIAVENEILEGNRCPIHEIPLTREQEENWFFNCRSSTPCSGRQS
jgi:hypothetical protein